MWRKVYLILLMTGTVLSEGIVFETRLGKLEGSTSTSRDGKEFYAFRGVPYAERTERFQIAQLVRPWNGVKLAAEFGKACPQFDPVTKTFIGEDDCLFLNVYTPVKMSSTNSKLPVMVWLHPGGFETGKSDDFDPKYFMDESVVLVTINYRLGALGFLTTLDDMIPGNLGMRDQVLSLHWVQRNIDAFGGDPSKVTLFGCNAGGASVHYQLLSPMSKGLFRNAISQSGSALSPWSLQRDPASNAKQLGEHLKCPAIDTSEQLMQCLKTKSAAEIVVAQQKFRKWSMFPFNTFAPVVESHRTRYERFLEDTPIHLSLSGKFNKLPWVTGFVEEEGVILSTIIITNDKLVNEINEDWSRVMPIVLLYEHLTDQEVRDNATTKIMNHYFGHEEIGEGTWGAATQLLTDRYFLHSISKAAEFHAKHAPVYTFEFTFPGGEYSPILKTFFGVSGDYGVVHTDELQYLFNGFYGAPSHDDPNKQEAYELSKNFVKLWVSFAAENKPTATWKDALKWDPIPANLGTSPMKFYQITSKTSISDGGFKERLSLWDGLNIDHFKSSAPDNMERKEEL